MSKRFKYWHGGKYGSQDPEKYRLDRVIKGSIIDAINAHPDWAFDRRFLGSISKRTVALLSDRIKDAVAGKPVTFKKERMTKDQYNKLQIQIRAMTVIEHGRKEQTIKTLLQMIGSLALEARQNQNHEREKAFIEVLKLLAKAKKSVDEPPDIADKNNKSLERFPFERDSS